MASLQDILFMLWRGKSEQQCLESLKAKFLHHTHNLNGVVDKDEWSYLHWAVQNNYWHLACFLIKHGIRVGHQDKFGANAIMTAAYLGRKDFVELFCEGSKPFGVDPPPDLTILLAQRNKYNSTVLHYAALRNQAEICDYLIKKDPSLIDKADKNGDTALHHACFHGFGPTVELLLDRKANGNLRNRVFKIPLDVGLEQESLDAMTIKRLHEFHEEELPPLLDHTEIRKEMSRLLRKETLAKYEKREIYKEKKAQAEEERRQNILIMAEEEERRRQKMMVPIAEKYYAKNYGNNNTLNPNDTHYSCNSNEQSNVVTLNQMSNDEYATLNQMSTTNDDYHFNQHFTSGMHNATKNSTPDHSNLNTGAPPSAGSFCNLMGTIAENFGEMSEFSMEMSDIMVMSKESRKDSLGGGGASLLEGGSSSTIEGTAEGPPSIDGTAGGPSIEALPEGSPAVETIVNLDSSMGLGASPTITITADVGNSSKESVVGNDGRNSGIIDKEATEGTGSYRTRKITARGSWDPESEGIKKNSSVWDPEGDAIKDTYNYSKDLESKDIESKDSTYIKNPLSKDEDFGIGMMSQLLDLRNNRLNRLDSIKESSKEGVHNNQDIVSNMPSTGRTSSNPSSDPSSNQDHIVHRRRGSDSSDNYKKNNCQSGMMKSTGSNNTLKVNNSSTLKSNYKPLVSPGKKLPKGVVMY